MKALARFFELKGHKHSAANTKKKKKLGATTGFIACKKGGFLAGCTCTLHKIKPNSTSCYKSLTEPQGSVYPFRGMRHEQLLLWDTRESRRRNKNRAHREMQQTGNLQLVTLEKKKSRREYNSTCNIHLNKHISSPYVAENHKGWAFRRIFIDDKNPNNLNLHSVPLGALDP